MKRILIIDDSIDLLQLLRMFLVKDYKVKTLSDCDKIIDTVKEYDPDLIMMDVFLAGEDGREVCKKLRKYAETKHMYIMLLSGSAEALNNYKEYGADAIIEKPFDIKILLDKIEQVLAGGHQ
jgi:DNA-binding response OmpR family regulator